MASPSSSSLQLPSFLHGSRSEVLRKTRAEGRRCAEQYARDGSLPQPHESLPVRPDEAVFTHELVDFQPSAPTWRLYGVSELLMSLCDALREQVHHRILREAHEATFRETAWGALFYATAELAPHGAERTGQRLAAVLRFWDALRHGRYLHKRLGEFLTLEQLLVASRGWALEAWCPEGGDSVRARLEVASERLMRATKEDCVETLVCQLPGIVPHAAELAHPGVVTDPSFWRERLLTLDEASFERISAGCPAWVLQRLYIWDKQLGRH
jgi:hypothetical protein